MQKTYTTLTIIFSAFVFSSLIYLLIGFALSRSGWKPAVAEGTLPQILFIVFSVLSMMTVGLAVKIRNEMFGSGAARPESQEHLQRFVVSRHVLQFALSEVPAILGLVTFLLTGKFLFLAVLCSVSLFAFGLMRPSLERLSELERRFHY